MRVDQIQTCGQGHREEHADIFCLFQTKLLAAVWTPLSDAHTLPVWLTLRAWTVCLNLISSGHTYVTCNTAEKPGHVRYKLNFLSQAQFNISDCFSQHPDFSFHIMRLFFFACIICKIYLLGCWDTRWFVCCSLVSQPITFSAKSFHLVLVGLPKALEINDSQRIGPTDSSDFLRFPSCVAMRLDFIYEY